MSAKKCSGVDVHFDGWTETAIEDVKKYGRNNHTHSDEQVALIAKSVRHQGWRWPIIVSRRSGYIVAGHGRLEAAKLLKVATVPVVYQDFPDARSEEAFRLADNRLPELAEQQTAIIKDLLEELDTGDFDMELTGYTEKMREQMMTAAADVPYGDTATDRDGQGVASTWESCRKTGAAPVRIGPWESRLPIELAEAVVADCARQFEKTGKPMHERLAELLTCGLR